MSDGRATTCIQLDDVEDPAIGSLDEGSGAETVIDPSQATIAMPPLAPKTPENGTYEFLGGAQARSPSPSLPAAQATPPRLPSPSPLRSTSPPTAQTVVKQRAEALDKQCRKARGSSRTPLASAKLLTIKGAPVPYSPCVPRQRSHRHCECARQRPPACGSSVPQDEFG